VFDHAQTIQNMQYFTELKGTESEIEWLHVKFTQQLHRGNHNSNNILIISSTSDSNLKLKTFVKQTIYNMSQEKMCHFTFD